MANNLVKLIFDQFVSTVERLGMKKHCKLNCCKFDYRVRSHKTFKVMDVVYFMEDECGRTSEAVVVIDITNICTEDLVTESWVEYLEKQAHEMLSLICPKKVVIIKTETKCCREQPKKWCPSNCRCYTVIHKEPEPMPVCECECEVIVNTGCECVPICGCEEKKETHSMWRTSGCCGCN